MHQKVIYLDQNIWICLAQAYYGRNRNPDDAKVCKAVLKASESDKVIFPLSAVHMVETHRNNQQQRRERLIDFMIEVSKMYTIPNYEYLIYAELYRAIIKRLDPEVFQEMIKRLDPRYFQQIINYFYPAVNIKDFIIRKGISNMLANNEIKGLDNKEAFIRVCKNEEASNVVRANRYLDYIRADNIEKWRNQVICWNEDRNRRSDAFFSKAFVDEIVGKIVRIKHLELDFPKEVLSPKELCSNQNDIINFSKDVPTFDVFSELFRRRLNDYNKPLETNDFYDIASLAVAIPYCDIVVAEKKFSAIAKDAKLDKIYNTIILSSIKELGQNI